MKYAKFSNYQPIEYLDRHPYRLFTLIAMVLSTVIMTAIITGCFF